MATLSFETLSFSKNKEYLQVTLLRLFSTKIPLKEVKEIGDFKLIDKHTIEFSYPKAGTKFAFLLDRYFDKLTNKLTSNKATYIHQNSGIPLIGNVAFGIVYRDSSIIEIKPITSCNLNCVYCSISEGLNSKKQDFVVEKDYLISELDQLVSFIDEPVEVHIGVQGEPFLYADMELLISDLEKMKNVHTISVDTNGTLLTKEMIDGLAKNNKLQINFSLDAVDETVAKEMSGVKNYNVGHVKEMIKYASDKVNVVVAPVFVDGYNNEEMEKIIEFVKSLPGKVKLGIQNFLKYKTGKKIAKALQWSEFYGMLEKLEKKHDIQLKWTKEDFNVRKTKELPKPFQVDDVINAVIKCPDRFDNGVIAVSEERCISIPDCQFKQDKQVKVKILRDKHNVFTGKVI